MCRFRSAPNTIFPTKKFLVANQWAQFIKRAMQESRSLGDKKTKPLLEVKRHRSSDSSILPHPHAHRDITQAARNAVQYLPAGTAGPALLQLYGKSFIPGGGEKRWWQCFANRSALELPPQHPYSFGPGAIRATLLACSNTQTMPIAWLCQRSAERKGYWTLYFFHHKLFHHRSSVWRHTVFGAANNAAS